ncbi:MAG: YggS family pyridoxal phosphate-dependent enzyme [Dethiobacter sp.]|jgi:pyridoxal phosphate enzyme (YggS family)|nr:YggS family pyridoxal phosphate-dependent enzyme [Dethiobacter sp.]
MMLEQNLQRVRKEIAAAARRSGRDPGDVRLVAVTKTVGVESVRQAAALGLKDFGENRLQEAREKVAAFPELCWHFIGRLQSNKVKDVITHFTLIHSLDRFSLAEELQRCGDRLDLEFAALVQVNVAGEDSKSGLDPSELPDFLDALRRMPRIKVEGLMTMAPWADDPEEVRPVFRQLWELRRKYRSPEMNLPHLSMGMTGDFAVAVEEGATMVRIGSALFGVRRG